MHLIIGFLGSLVTILYLLDRLGIDIGGLNPFGWRRRRAWKKKYEGDPIYAVEDSMELAALFVVGTAKLAGDLTAEQKNKAMELFSSNFDIDSATASSLYTSSSHLFGATQVVDSQLGGLLQRSEGKFSGKQLETTVSMMRAVATSKGNLYPAQSDFIERFEQAFNESGRAGAGWEQ